MWNIDVYLECHYPPVILLLCDDAYALGLLCKGLVRRKSCSEQRKAILKANDQRACVFYPPISLSTKKRHFAPRINRYADEYGKYCMKPDMF